MELKSLSSGPEGCCFGYLISLVGLVGSIVLDRFCEIVIIWVPPEVTFAVFVILLLLFHPNVTLRLLDGAFGVFGLCVQAAESFAEDVGRFLMR